MINADIIDAIACIHGGYAKRQQAKSHRLTQMFGAGTGFIVAGNLQSQLKPKLAKLGSW